MLCMQLELSKNKLCWNWAFRRCGFLVPIAIEFKWKSAPNFTVSLINFVSKQSFWLHKLHLHWQSIQRRACVCGSHILSNFEHNSGVIFSVALLEPLRGASLPVACPWRLKWHGFTHVVPVSRLFLLSVPTLLQRAVSGIHSFSRYTFHTSPSATVEKK